MSREFFPERVLGVIMLNPHPFADEIKRKREVKVLRQPETTKNELLLTELTIWTIVTHLGLGSCVDRP
jgi:hypothetical protein